MNIFGVKMPRFNGSGRKSRRKAKPPFGLQCGNTFCRECGSRTIFSRVFVLAVTGTYKWRRGAGWRKLTGGNAEGHGPSFDKLKGVLNDPEWLNDPDGKAMRVAMGCLREMRGNGDASRQ